MNYRALVEKSIDESLMRSPWWNIDYNPQKKEVWNNWFAVKTLIASIAIASMMVLYSTQFIRADSVNNLEDSTESLSEDNKENNEHVGIMVLPLLLDIEKVTGVRMWKFDIPVIVNLVTKSQWWSLPDWQYTYGKVIDSYVNLAPYLEIILTKHGLNPNWVMA